MSTEEVASLKELIFSKLSDHEKALEIARKNMEKRLDGMNEFRDALKDQAVTFMTREYYEARHKDLIDQVNDLRISKAVLESKASIIHVYVSWAIALIALAIAWFK